MWTQESLYYWIYDKNNELLYISIKSGKKTVEDKKLNKNGVLPFTSDL